MSAGKFVSGPFRVRVDKWLWAARFYRTRSLAAQAIEHHHKETTNQVARLEQVFKLVDMAPKGKKCPGIEGLLEEAKEVMDEAEDPKTRDAGMLAAAQSVEHYEISRYGTLIAWAEQLGMREAASILGETLAEEKKADKLLSQLAEGKVNREAA